MPASVNRVPRAVGRSSRSGPESGKLSGRPATYSTGNGLNLLRAPPRFAEAFAECVAFLNGRCETVPAGLGAGRPRKTAFFAALLETALMVNHR